MRTESPIQFSLQTLAEFDRTDDVSYKLREKTLASIQVLSREGLKTPNHSLFLLSATKLISLVSSAEFPKPSIFRFGDTDVDECMTAANFCADEIETLEAIVKNKSNDQELATRQELSIKLIIELHKNGDETIKRITKEALSRLQPHIIRGMIRGRLNFDEAEYLYLKEFPFAGRSVVKDFEEQAGQMPKSEFAPLIKAVVAASEPEVSSTGEKIAGILLAQLGFTKEEICELTGDSECEPEYKADNIDAIFAVDRHARGISRWLMHSQGIKHFGRYPTELLLDQFRFIDDRKNPWGLILYPDSDFNGAYHESFLVFGEVRKQLKEIDKKDGPTFRLRIVEGENLLSIAKSVIRLQRQYGPASFAIVGGHGDPQGIQFGDKYDISELVKYDLNEGKGIRRGIKMILKPGATVILDSCQTGKKNGFAQSLSKLGFNVIAPEKDSSPSEIELSFINKKLVIRQTFDPGPDNEFKNGKLVKKKK